MSFFQFYLSCNICLFLLKLLFLQLLIMFKCCSDHLSLFCAIVKESVEMLLFCDCCSFLNKQCFVSDKFEKYSECVKLKCSCSFSCSVYITDVSYLFHACEKLDCDKKSVLKKYQKFSTCLVELDTKIFYLKCHQCFFKKCDDKLIQESIKVFEKKLCVLKRK